MKVLTLKRLGESFILSCLLSVGLLSGCDRETNTKPAPFDPAVIEKRDDAIRQLVAETGSVLEPLKKLDQNDKNAVVALLALTKSVGQYENTALHRDDKIINAYYKGLSDFSENFSRVFDVKSFILSCFDATVSCLSARKECLDEGKSENECDRDPRVLAPCANEAICITKQFLKIKKGIPDILGGRTPWPPQPKPF